jgi:hypothetical protein
MIAVTQIAIHDFSRDQPAIYRISYLFSAFVMAIIVFEICSAYFTLSLMSSKGMRKLKGEEMPKELVSYDQALLLEEMTEGLSKSSAKRGNTMMLDSLVHFLAIQMLVSTLQQLPQLQVTAILLTEIAYIFRFVVNYNKACRKYVNKKAAKSMTNPKSSSGNGERKKKVKKATAFDSKWFQYAFILQQISVMIIIFVVFMSMVKSTDGNFFKSFLFLMMEISLIISVVVVIFSQLALVVLSLVRLVSSAVKNCWSKRKQKTQVTTEPKRAKRGVDSETETQIKIKKLPSVGSSTRSERESAGIKIKQKQNAVDKVVRKAKKKGQYYRYSQEGSRNRVRIKVRKPKKVKKWSKSRKKGLRGGDREHENSTININMDRVKVFEPVMESQRGLIHEHPGTARDKK